MIHESVIDSCLNRLSAHFGPLVMIRPPATAADLADLERTVGPLPRDLTIFLSTCNGLRVGVVGLHEELHMWHVREMLAAICDCSGSPVAAGLVPVRGDVSGPRDCLVLEAGDVHGTVVAWDAWVPGAELLSSSFGHYLDAWVNFLIANYEANGRSKQDEAPGRFDAVFTGRCDSDVTSLRNARTTREWLNRLDACASSGADFE